MYVSFNEKGISALPREALCVTHYEVVVSDSSMAGIPAPVCGDREVATTSSTWIW